LVNRYTKLKGDAESNLQTLIANPIMDSNSNEHVISLSEELSQMKQEVIRKQMSINEMKQVLTQTRDKVDQVWSKFKNLLPQSNNISSQQ